MSEVAERAQATVRTLAEIVRKITKPIALEVFLRREPTDAEIDTLSVGIAAFSAQEEAWREEFVGRIRTAGQQ